MAENFVWMPPQGLVIVLQYWAGDEAQVMRLARLLADIEPRRRSDVYLCLFRRFDMPETRIMHETKLYCGFKFPVMSWLARREGAGHPAGCNALWSSCMEQFSEEWRAGRLNAHSIFTAEADGVPLRADWVDLLVRAHAATLTAGRRVTGPIMQRIPHINGSLIAHLSLWFDRLSLHETPSTQGWDLFHGATLLAEGRAEPWIKNIYGACNWSPESLFALSHETAWLASQKDDTAIEWAEQNLVATSSIRKARRGGCYCPDPRRCKVETCRCDCGDCGGRLGRIERIGELRAQIKAKARATKEG